MKHWTLLGGVGIALVVITLVACSDMMGKATDKAQGYFSKDKKTDDASTNQPSSASAQPAGASGAGSGAGTGSGPGGAGGAGGSGRMNAMCAGAGGSREDTSRCYRNIANQTSQSAEMCAQRAESGADVKNQSKLEECRDKGRQAAKAYNCMADGVLKPGSQYDEVQKTCLAASGLKSG